MMALYVFRLPDIGEGVAEAEIVAWHVKPGDVIEEDQALGDVMTDKAMVDMTSPVAGTVLAIHGEIGEMLAVGAPFVEFEVAGEGNEALSVAPPVVQQPVEEKAAPPIAAPPIAAAPVAAPVLPRPNGLPAMRAADEHVLAAPATRRRAFDLGIPLQFVPGTGPGGRVTSEDLDHFIATGGQVAAASSGPATRTAIHEQKIIGLRRKIAEKMEASKRRIPHFGYVEEFDMTALEALRRELNVERSEDQPKLTLLPFFMRAVALLQADFPHVNARYDDAANVLYRHDGVHIGIATQTDGGLMVPVVRHVEARDIWGCARELLRVTGAARDGSASREDLSGSTITLTSLGTLGGISATPVINAPEVAIIGPNKLVDRPVIIAGQIVIRTMMNVSTSFDHRIVDGQDAARFVQRMKRLIENPALLFTVQS